MTRDQVVGFWCRLSKLITESPAYDFGHPADCICEDRKQDPSLFRHDGVTLQYARDAVVEKLKRDGQHPESFPILNEIDSMLKVCR